MFDYLDRFNNLDEDIRSFFESEDALEIIEKLETRYKIDLASVIMRVAIKDINLESLPLVFFTELGLGQDQSEDLYQELRNNIFVKLGEYFGIDGATASLNDAPQQDSSSNQDTSNEVEEKFVELDEGIFSRNETSVTDNDVEEEGSGEGALEEFEEISDNIKSLSDEPYLDEPEFVNSYLKTDYSNKIQKQALEIASILNLKFDDDRQATFLSLMEKYFRGVKEKVELRQFFSRPADLNGLGLKDKMIDNLFMIADDIQLKGWQEERNQVKPAEDVLKKIDRLGVGFLPLIEDKKILPPPDSSHLLSQPSLKPLPAPNNDSLPPTALPETDNMVDGIGKEGLGDDVEEDPGLSDEFLAEMDVDFIKFEQEILSELEEEVKREETAYKAIEDSRRNLGIAIPPSALSPTSTSPSPTPAPLSQKAVALDQDHGNKIKMTDVKKVKIMSPVDEIRYLNLVNFRRLSKDPEEALEKIREKLKNLEDLDFNKMVDGVKAWRQNQINKTYLKIFIDASSRGVGVEQVINELKTEKKDFLTMEEIQAILKFNKSLRF